MSDDMCDTVGCPWSEREAELLAITLELLQEHGYDRLSVEAVATRTGMSRGPMIPVMCSLATWICPGELPGGRFETAIGQ